MKLNKDSFPTQI